MHPAGEGWVTRIGVASLPAACWALRHLGRLAGRTSAVFPAIHVITAKGILPRHCCMFLSMLLPGAQRPCESNGHVQNRSRPALASSCSFTAATASSIFNTMRSNKRHASCRAAELTGRPGLRPAGRHQMRRSAADAPSRAAYCQRATQQRIQLPPSPRGAELRRQRPPPQRDAPLRRQPRRRARCRALHRPASAGCRRRQGRGWCRRAGRRGATAACPGREQAAGPDDHLLGGLAGAGAAGLDGLDHTVAVHHLPAERKRKGRETADSLGRFQVDSSGQAYTYPLPAPTSARATGARTHMRTFRAASAHRATCKAQGEGAGAHPNTTCFPSSQGVAATQRKNWEPLVFGPALAMLSTPGPLCRSVKFSSANLRGPPMGTHSLASFWRRAARKGNWLGRVLAAPGVEQTLRYERQGRHHSAPGSALTARHRCCARRGRRRR